MLNEVGVVQAFLLTLDTCYMVLQGITVLL